MSTRESGVMQGSPYILSVIAALFAACGSPTAPGGALAGSWRTAPIPSGAGTGLSLQATGTYVTGTFGVGGLMGVAKDSGTVTGVVANGSFGLTLTYASGGTGTFGGWLVGLNQLRGTWSPPQAPAYDVTFFRQ